MADSFAAHRVQLTPLEAAAEARLDFIVNTLMSAGAGTPAIRARMMLLGCAPYPALEGGEEETDIV